MDCWARSLKPSAFDCNLFRGTEALGATELPSPSLLEVGVNAFQGNVHGRGMGSCGCRHGGQGAVLHTCVDTLAGKSRAQVLRGQSEV